MLKNGLAVLPGPWAAIVVPHLVCALETPECPLAPVWPPLRGAGLGLDLEPQASAPGPSPSEAPPLPHLPSDHHRAHTPGVERPCDL